MRTYLLLFPAALLVCLGAACTAQPPAKVEASQPDFAPTATIREIMQAMVAPQADVLWNAVATEVNASGVTEKAPSTDEEWTKLHHDAMMLVEATNLIQMQGRHVANPGEKAQDEKAELTPEQIDQRINQDRQAWGKFAHGLRDSVMVAVQAIDARDATKLNDAGEAIDKACEDCHLQYWYPNQGKQ